MCREPLGTGIGRGAGSRAIASLVTAIVSKVLAWIWGIQSSNAVIVPWLRKSVGVVREINRTARTLSISVSVHIGAPWSERGGTACPYGVRTLVNARNLLRLVFRSEINRTARTLSISVSVHIGAPWSERGGTACPYGVRTLVNARNLLRLVF